MSACENRRREVTVWCVWLEMQAVSEELDSESPPAVKGGVATLPSGAGSKAVQAWLRR